MELFGLLWFYKVLVRSGAVWCGLVWSCAVCCGFVRFGVIWCCLVWFGVSWCGTELSGGVLCGLVWFAFVVLCGLVWSCVARCGVVLFLCGPLW